MTDQEIIDILLKKKQLPSRGSTYNIIHSKNMYDRIRERLSLTKKQLPDKLIKQQMTFINESLMEYIFDNPEGISLEVGGNLHGVLAISKHMPKEMRSNKFEKLEEIENFNMPEWKKNIYRKRYATSLERRFDHQKIKDGIPQIHVNSHSFFYTYKIIWFNHRNCKIKKARAYEFTAGSKYRNKLYDVIKNQSKDFFEWNFNDFYRYKIKPIY